MTDISKKTNIADDINQKALKGTVKVTSSDLQDLLNLPKSDYASFNIYKFISDQGTLCVGGLASCAKSALEYLENNPQLNGLTLDLTDATCDTGC